MEKKIKLEKVTLNLSDVGKLDPAEAAFRIILSNLKADLKPSAFSFKDDNKTKDKSVK